jgi:integrase
MNMGYERWKKGYDPERPKISKADREKFFTRDQVKILLDQIKAQGNPKWKRDHAAVFITFHLGLRAGETVLLRREHFRDLEKDLVYVPTLKRAQRIVFSCPSCGRKTVFGSGKGGKRVTCPKCAKKHLFRKQRDRKKGDSSLGRNIPEISPPVIPRALREYLRTYLGDLPPEQIWLFEGRPGRKMTVGALRQNFNHYLVSSGLPPVYSFHALRHGWGVVIGEIRRDPVHVRDMLRHKSVRTSEIYVHMGPQAKREYQSALDEQALILE